MRTESARQKQRFFFLTPMVTAMASSPSSADDHPRPAACYRKSASCEGCIVDSHRWSRSSFNSGSGWGDGGGGEDADGDGGGDG